MTDQNALNFDFDAPASPSLTLDPSADLAAPASAAAEQPAVPAPEEVRLSPEEQKMVEDFAEKIDLTNSQQVLQYGAASQKKIGDFSEAALAKVSTKDLGEVGEMITSLIGELKNFDAAEEEKGLFGFFKKKQNQLESLKNKYNTAEKNGAQCDCADPLCGASGSAGMFFLPGLLRSLCMKAVVFITHSRVLIFMIHIGIKAVKIF